MRAADDLQALQEERKVLYFPILLLLFFFILSLFGIDSYYKKLMLCFLHSRK
jgi:hypothetical protein